MLMSRLAYAQVGIGVVSPEETEPRRKPMTDHAIYKGLLFMIHATKRTPVMGLTEGCPSKTCKNNSIRSEQKDQIKVRNSKHSLESQEDDDHRHANEDVI